MYRPNLKSLALPVPEIIAIEVLGGVANPQSWGRGGCMGSAMVPFERALVSSYRPSIVTFSLSLRVSEILPLLCSSTPLFSTPPLVSPKFPHVRWMAFNFWAAKSVGVGLIVRAISFEDFQPMWSQSANVTDGETDRRTTCERNTTLWTIVHRAVIISTRLEKAKQVFITGCIIVCRAIIVRRA